MSTHDAKSETPDSVPQGGRPRRRFTSVAAVLATGVVLGVFAGSSVGRELGHRMLAYMPGMAAFAARFEDGFGPGLAPDWQSGLPDGAIAALVEAHADRMIRHLSVDIDATAEQQEKLRAIVRDALTDLLPVRKKMQAARATAPELLTQQTIDRAAIEKFRTEQIAIHDAVSKRLVAAVADAAEALTPAQRRKLITMLPGQGGRWGAGWWGHRPGRALIWRN